MVIALDPLLPRVWRSPRAVQFGVERPALVLEPVGLAEERMLDALDTGARLSALRVIARTAGAPRGTAEALLSRLAPVLAPEPERRRPPIVVLDGAGPTAARILALLREAGMDVRAGLAADDPAVDAASAAVLVAAYAVSPPRHQRWLRRDIPHLPVVFGDRSVTVGPYVTPGAGPCVRCGDLARRDADRAWPALAAQLHARERPGEGELVSMTVAAAAATAVLRPPPVGTVRRWDREALRWSEETRAAHPACGCLSPAGPRGPLARSRSGSGRPAC